MPPSHPLPPDADEARRVILRMKAEIDQLAETDTPPDVFFREFIGRVVVAHQALGGAVWLREPSGQLRLAGHCNISEPLKEALNKGMERHAGLLNQVMSDNDARFAPPAIGDLAEVNGNPTTTTLLLAPLRSDRVEGVVEVFQRPDTRVPELHLRLLQDLCDSASDWLKKVRLRLYADQEARLSQQVQFAKLVHGSLDHKLTANILANETRRLIGCDRVSVSVTHGDKQKIVSVSGQDRLEARSNVVSRLSKLATRVARTGERFHYNDPREEFSEQITEVLHRYLQDSTVKSIIIAPLRRPAYKPESSPAEQAAEEIDPRSGPIIGALILEQIENRFNAEQAGPKLDLAVEQGSVALANALQHSRLFLMPVWRVLGYFSALFRGRMLPKTLAVLALLAAAALALWLVPADFDLSAEGALQPRVRQEVFAGGEGIVKTVHVDTGARVAKGQVLAELLNLDLLIQQRNVRGQLSADEQRLWAVERVLLQGRQLPSEQRMQMAGERAQLTDHIENLKKQEALLVEKLALLVVKSPFDGEIISWNAKQQLQDRPVTPDQVLFTVADPKGEWELELFLPDHQTHHLKEAAKRLAPGERLPVEFILASDPGVRRRGVVAAVQPAAQTHEEKGHSVLIRVELLPDNANKLEQPHAGAAVTAGIHCGRRPVGYVWFHRAYEWLQTNVFF